MAQDIVCVQHKTCYIEEVYGYIQTGQSQHASMYGYVYMTYACIYKRTGCQVSYLHRTCEKYPMCIHNMIYILTIYIMLFEAVYSMVVVQTITHLYLNLLHEVAVSIPDRGDVAGVGGRVLAVGLLGAELRVGQGLCIQCMC